MKKQLFIIGICLVLSVVLVAGCLGGNNDANNSSNNSSNNSTNNTSFVPPDPIAAPADTAIYRGNVTNITTTSNTTTMTLAQVKGTDFGAASVKFVFNNDSKMNFNLSDLKTGQYVEVYYDVPTYLGTNFSKTQTVIVANVLQYANMTVFNGEIVNVTPAVNTSNSTYIGKIEVKLENNSTMIFNCNNATQFYMNMSNVKAGTHVNIYGNWIIQTSMPPQNTAYEVYDYYSDSADFVPPDPIDAPADLSMYRGTVTNITKVNNTTTMTLAQAKGTNYGAESVKFAFTGSSQTNFNLSDLKTGQYVEVYYGVPPNTSTNFSQTHNVIVANVLQYANMTVFNGQIVNVTPAVNTSNSTYVGKIEVKLENNSTMIFNCNNATQFYMNMSNVKAGMYVNIYGNWIITASMPPQTTAYEVNEYNR